MSYLLFIDAALDAVASFIGGLLYSMFSMIFVVIDIVQDVFSAFAGIGNINFAGTPISGNAGAGGGETEQGIVYYLMQNEVITNLLASIMLLALLLIVIFTTMAFLKNLYVNKPKNWKEIIGSSIKGLANFIFLPVCCLFAVWMGNVLLQAINGATSSSGAVKMSRKLFICCAYNANLYRNGDATGAGLAKQIVAQYGAGSAAADAIQTGQSDEYYAQIVDNIYVESTKMNLEARHVEVAYSLWDINYLIMIVGGIFMIYVLGALAFGMVKRLFYLLVLFVISPALCALYPLDDGSAVKSWSGEFKKQTLSAYGAVAGLNIFFSLLPLVEKIEIVGVVASWPGVNFLVQLFIMISGLMIVKDLIGLLSGYVGGGNAYGDGAGLMKGAHGHFKKHAGNMAGKATSVTGAFVKAGAAGKTGGAGAWFKSMGKSMKDGAVGSITSKYKELTGVDVQANWDKVKKLGKEGKAFGARQAQTKKFATDYGEAKKNMDAKDAELETAEKTLKDAIAALEAEKEKKKKGISKQADVDKAEQAVADARKGFSDASKASSSARDRYYRTIDNAPAGIRSLVMEELGKKEGLSGSEFDKKVQKSREFLQTQSKAEDSASKLKGAESSISELITKITKTDENGNFVGIDATKAAPKDTKLAEAIKGLEKTMETLGLGMEQLGDFLKNGVTIGDSLTEGKNLSPEDLVAISNFNRQVEQEQGKRDAWQGDMDAFAKLVSKMAGEMKEDGTKVELDGQKVDITEGAIKALSAAIRDGKDLEGLSEAIVQAMTTDAKTRERSLDGVLKDLAKIRKLIEDANKK